MRRSGRERGRLRARRWGPARTAGSSTPAFHYFPLFCFLFFHSPFPGNLLLLVCGFFSWVFFLFLCVLGSARGRGSCPPPPPPALLLRPPGSSRRLVPDLLPGPTPLPARPR